MIYLDNTELPVILVTYDCVIDSVSFSDDFLIYDFGQHISVYDLIQHICFAKDAKSLIIKIHLFDTFDIQQEKIRKFSKIKGLYAEIDFNLSE